MREGGQSLMPTPVQIEAQLRLNRLEEMYEGFDRLYKVAAKPANLLVPGCGVFFQVIRLSMKGMRWLDRDDAYETALKEVIRGERDTLPDEPRDEGLPPCM
jgi:hypothetical protein